jgi:hypothetical protein
LHQAREQAEQAKRQLSQIRVENALNEINLLLDQANLPVNIEQAVISDKQVDLRVQYWGYMVGEREALHALSQFDTKLRAAFPGRRLPEDFVVTFRGLQNNRSTVYRQGLWEPTK